MNNSIEIKDIVDLIDTTQGGNTDEDTLYDETVDLAISRTKPDEIVFISKCQIAGYNKIANVRVGEGSFPELDEATPTYTTIALSGLDLQDPVEQQLVAASLSVLWNACASGGDLLATLNKLHSFFGSKLTSENASKSKITGLMGELFVMRYLGQPPHQTLGDSVDAWHETPTDAYDFFYPISGRKIEIKSTLSGTRSHSFSSNQISPHKDDLNLENNLNIFICSIKLNLSMQKDSTSPSYSLSEILSEYEKELTVSQYEKLERVVLATIDGEISDYDDYHYSINTDAIKIYDTEGIPKPVYNPASIKNVRWTATLPEENSITPVWLNLNKNS